jgi:hypothetical protein
LLGILPAPFEIFSQIDNFGVKGKSKQTLLFEIVFDLFDHKAVFGYFNREFDLLDLVFQLIDC